MKHVEAINQFREELSSLSREVESAVAMGYLDINKICEDVFCGIFKELYGLANLRKLNSGAQNCLVGLADAVHIHQGNVPRWYEELDDLDETAATQIIILLDLGHDLGDALESPSMTQSPIFVKPASVRISG
ncbi:hypothetical protein DWB85_06425 [Seongchinamella sediminis]|uniref:SMEK domain-containing protein n=1 Tax=Seongchinamella sediminis TaxID=2283635 RepID=A0A3L7DZD7_9GAMM|nr:SMEK domain-containing protein [Seongchinamella sediminis]RLQ22614.1 hypothetical protein DWB85_06425 [Seongchinamella sediminis]